ncbi:MAG: hypothetical protein LIP03_04710 [Bacteroidales bacterium]|nr:hypothetical protein [Bacteroidales bacterium]
MIIDDLSKLLPKATVRYDTSRAIVTESSLQSKINHLEWTGSCFQCIDPAIAKEMSSVFQKFGNQNNIFCCDCDGLTIFEHEGQKYLFLTELKSNFDSKDLYHACEQLISSYIKINMVLSLLPTYEKEEFIVKGFIAMRPPNKDVLLDWHAAQFARPNKSIQRENQLALSLCHHNPSKSLIIKPSTHGALKDFNLGPKGIFKEMELIFVPVDSGNGISLDVKRYI